MRTLMLMTGGRKPQQVRVFASDGFRFVPQNPTVIPFFSTSNAVHRRRLLDAIFSRPDLTMEAIAYPVEEGEPIKEAEVFLSPRDTVKAPRLIAACTVISQARLRAIVESGLLVVENYSIQIAESEHLEHGDIARAVGVWRRRTHPNSRVEVFDVSIFGLQHVRKHHRGRVDTKTGNRTFAPTSMMFQGASP